MPKISVAICCKDSEATLEAACQSVGWADELVIVDSGSSDGTEAIARRYADRFVVEPWRGYTEQKKYSASLCKNDWVLILDSDEACSAELADEISSLTTDECSDIDVFHVKRRNYILGRYVRCWDPDFQSRLIHRNRCQWRDEVLHDARLPSHPTRQRKLSGWLTHNQDSMDYANYFSGSLMDRRLALVAQDMFDRGKRCSWFDLAIRPMFAFFKFYVLKGAFRDGTFGFFMAQKAAVSVQLKYATLWALQSGAVFSSQTNSTAESRQKAA